MPVIRQPAVAGLFYPDDISALKSFVTHALKKVQPQNIVPKAIVAPHAGYTYSGEIAASVYKLLEPLRDKITRVVLLGPTHRVAVYGCAVPEAEFFRTPLGDVPVDTESIKILSQKPNVHLSDFAHKNEHSLEVHLPFLQTVLNKFTLVPIAVGDMSADAIMELLELFWEDTKTLIVVSSDLSHFHDYDTAKKIDQHTTQLIEDLQVDVITGEMACGTYPLNGLIKFAKKHHLTCETLDLRNSGDTAGDKHRVVGYGAYAFY